MRRVQTHLHARILFPSGRGIGVSFCAPQLNIYNYASSLRETCSVLFFYNYVCPFVQLSCPFFSPLVFYPWLHLFIFFYSRHLQSVIIVTFLNFSPPLSLTFVYMIQVFNVPYLDTWRVIFFLHQFIISVTWNCLD